MGAAAHRRLRLVDVAGIESRENLVAVGIRQDAGPIDIFLGTESTLNAVHRADILSNIFSPFMFWVVPTASSKVAEPDRGPRDLHGRENEGVT